MSIALSKFLAQAGITSRRKVVDLIKERLIAVNGHVVTNPAHRVMPDDVITHRGKKIYREQKFYIVLNKPKGYITTVSDEKDRQTVMDLIHGIPARLYPIGRLDRDTTGLLLLTNDGYFAQQLAHPRYEISKTYTVTLDRQLLPKDREHIIKGLTLKDGFIQVDALQVPMTGNGYEVKVTLHSGKNRIVRRIFAHLGYFVVALDRIAYAGLTKRGLRIGQWRSLTEYEVNTLKQFSLRAKKEKKRSSRWSEANGGKSNGKSSYASNRPKTSFGTNDGRKL